jgi:hypothetical protein
MMKKYLLKYGLGGGFGGADSSVVKEFKNENDAINEAWRLACKKHESYAGFYGLRDYDQIMEEDGVDEKEAEDIFNEERENWLDYDAILFDEKKHS